VSDGYFVHFFAPADVPPLRKHVIFVAGRQWVHGRQEVASAEGGHAHGSQRHQAFGLLQPVRVRVTSGQLH
jgi:hypothetical protein